MNTCRLCHSRNMERVIKLASMPIGDAYLAKEHIKKQDLFDMDLFLCKNCGLAQLPEVVRPDDIYRPYIYRTSDSKGLVEHFRKYIAAIFDKYTPPKGSLVIDIGSNDGTLLRFCKDRGMKVLGFDPATTIACEATASGVPTCPEFFCLDAAKKARQNHGQAYVITANNVFANIDNVDSFMLGVKELLLPDGVFVFETGYVLDLLQKTIFDNIYHEHLSYYSVKPLDQFFKRHDMRIIDVERINTKGGSIRCFVQHTSGSRQQSPNVNTIMKLEEDCGVQDSQTFNLFSENINLVKRQLLTFLKRLKNNKRKIAGYGASIGVTTILYNCELGEGFIDYLVDDNPGREGLYSPGYHIPVLSPKELYAKKPDYAVILAWQYAGPIIAQHKQYLENGGYFILLLPQVRIIGKNDPIS